MKDIEKEIKRLYIKLQDEAGFKVGDIVKITQAAEKYTSGWCNSWIDRRMFTGAIGKITAIDMNITVQIGSYSFGYPFFVLEKVEPKTYCTDETEYILAKEMRTFVDMMVKHTVSLLDIVNKLDKGEIPTKELLAEKISDNMNYLILLETCIKERYKK